MEVEIDAELRRQLEKPVDLRLRIGVGVRAAAKQIGAVPQRLGQEFLGAGIIGQPFLRKHADRQVDRPGVIALELFDGREAAQAGARVDLHMRAHVGGPFQDRLLEHARPALVDVLDREAALQLRDGLDGRSEIAVVMRAAAEQAGLVEMNVSVDEAREDQPSAGGNLRRVGLQAGLDRYDLPIPDADVSRRFPARNPGLAQNPVEGSAAVHRLQATAPARFRHAKSVYIFMPRMFKKYAYTFGA